MQKGKIIYLEGVSSAGKTTLAKALQARLAEPFFLIGADTFFDTIPEKFWNVEFNNTAKKITSATNIIIKLFSDLGIDVIVDYVPVIPSITKIITTLHEYPVLYVHVSCPLEELRRRECERGDRPVGIAERQLNDLLPFDAYDLVIDTHNESQDESIDKICGLLNHPDRFTAFKKLYLNRQVHAE